MRQRGFWARQSVWTRLLTSILGIVAIVWLVLAMAFVFFLQVQRDYDQIAREQVPDLALANELAEHSARLLSFTTRLLGQDVRRPDVDLSELDPIRSGLAETLNRISAGRPQAVQHQLGRITVRLEELIDLQSRAGQLAGDLEAQMNALRWLNADIQAEAEPTLSDLAFNISLAMRSLAASSDPDYRARQVALIAEEGAKRDAVRRLSDGAAVSVTLLLQAAVAADETQLEQLRGLLDDALANLPPMLAQLPERAELATLKQSVQALFPLATGPSGIFQLRQLWLRNQAATLDRVQRLQQELNALQSNLAALSAEQRRVILHDTRQSLQSSQLAIRWLVALTVLTGLICAFVLWGPVRRGIVRPLRRMTRRLSDIAQAQNLQPAPLQPDNEISRLSLAIEEFERSIKTRDQALASLEAEVRERQRAVERLKLTQKELIQAGKMAALGQMSAGIAHELNQPLAAMQQRLHLLQDHAIAGDRAAQDTQLSRLDGLIRRMNRTISYLRNFARRAEFSDDQLCLGELVEAALALVHARVVEEQVTVTPDPALHQLRVRGDKILIEQVMVNLLSNALDAIQQGGTDGTIDISGRQDNGDVLFELRDNGAGLGAISPTAALDPFVTGKEVGKGLGLGLSISYNIMKDLGGDLSLAPNEATEGTTARLRLRAAPDTALKDAPDDTK